MRYAGNEEEEEENKKRLGTKEKKKEKTRKDYNDMTSREIQTSMAAHMANIYLQHIRSTTVLT